jgi:predicted transcriptional regulator of viral defense system
MDFDALLALLGDEPVFESSLLLSGDVDPQLVRLQLSRWNKSGRLYQLRRGLYALAPPFQKAKPHPFLIANRLHAASYVSLQSALAYYGLIPDIVQVTLSVTGGRPEQIETPLGSFVSQHVKPGMLSGYQMLELGNRQQALVAYPEKALLDLIYLTPGGDRTAYLDELRLQNLDRLDLHRLDRLAGNLAVPRLRRAAKRIAELTKVEARDYNTI